MEEFKNTLAEIKIKYDEQKVEPILSIFSLPHNTQLLADLTKEVSKQFNKSVKSSPELENDLINLSSDFIMEMTYLITGDQN